MKTMHSALLVLWLSQSLFAASNTEITTYSQSLAFFKKGEIEAAAQLSISLLDVEPAAAFNLAYLLDKGFIFDNRYTSDTLYKVSAGAGYPPALRKVALGSTNKDYDLLLQSARAADQISLFILGIMAVQDKEFKRAAALLKGIFQCPGINDAAIKKMAGVYLQDAYNADNSSQRVKSTLVDCDVARRYQVKNFESITSVAMPIFENNQHQQSDHKIAYAANTNHTETHLNGYDMALNHVRKGESSKGLALLEQLASNGDAEAAFQAALLLHSRDWSPSTKARVIHLYTIAADAGHRIAHYNLAIIYRKNDGADSKHLFFKHANAAFDETDADSIYLLGFANLLGYGTPPNIGKAVNFLQKSASMGNESARRLLEEVHRNDAY